MRARLQKRERMRRTRKPRLCGDIEIELAIKLHAAHRDQRSSCPALFAPVGHQAFRRLEVRRYAQLISPQCRQQLGHQVMYYRGRLIS